MYDLKGSLVNRFVCENNEGNKNLKNLNYKSLKRNNIEQSVQKLKKMNSFRVLKDVNFIESNDIFIEVCCKTRK